MVLTCEELRSELTKALRDLRADIRVDLKYEIDTITSWPPKNGLKSNLVVRQDCQDGFSGRKGVGEENCGSSTKVGPCSSLAEKDGTRAKQRAAAWTKLDAPGNSSEFPGKSSRELRAGASEAFVEETGIDETHPTSRLLPGNEAPDGCLSSVRGYILPLIPSIEFVVHTCIVLNSLLIGMETDFEVAHPEANLPFNYVMLEAFLCGIFVLDIVLRLVAHGRKFWCTDGWLWNVFDFVIVFSQVPFQYAELMVCLRAIDGHAGHDRWDRGVTNNLALLRQLRLIRALRLARFAATLRAFQEPREMMMSTVNSMRSLLWIVLLILCFIYAVSVLLIQFALMDQSYSRSDDMKFWFGTVSRTMVTLFESITGGLSWDVVIRVMSEASPGMIILFCGYISFSAFAMMNVVTGLFVSEATRRARERTDNHTVNLIRDVFRKSNEDRGSPDESEYQISKVDFKGKLESAEMQEYFGDMGIDIKDGDKIFELLDEDNSDSLSLDEVVEGCLRLRGQARSLDLAMAHRALVNEQGQILNLVQSLCRAMGALPLQTSMVEEELSISRTNSLFGRIDTNQDGSIDINEIDRAIRDGVLKDCNNSAKIKIRRSVTNEHAGLLSSPVWGFRSPS